MLQTVEDFIEEKQEQKIYEKLRDLIKQHTARVAIVGLGSVGLPEAVEFASAGFTVTGIDVSKEKVSKLLLGISYIQDVPQEQLCKMVKAGKLQATTDFSCISEMDTITICVPTPLTKSKEPDMSFIVSAMEHIKGYLRPGQLIVLESTTYPGTTVELLLPEFTKLNFKIGEDLFLAFSPERVDPGNGCYYTKNIPKVVGGVTERCTELATLLYQQAVDTVVPVSSPSVAEMAKLLENTFRSVNIGLANEFAMMCKVLKLNVWEVIKAASSKPFGFMPFYPGPGVGGHCIPLDPYYLSWKTRMLGFESRFIDLAGQINAQMPAYTVSLTMDALNDSNKCLRNSHIHIMGVISFCNEGIAL